LICLSVDLLAACSEKKLQELFYHHNREKKRVTVQ
jgi:hypothetical protein